MMARVALYLFIAASLVCCRTVSPVNISHIDSLNRFHIQSSVERVDSLTKIYVDQAKIRLSAKRDSLFDYIVQKSKITNKSYLAALRYWTNHVDNIDYLLTDNLDYVSLDFKEDFRTFSFGSLKLVTIHTKLDMYYGSVLHLFLIDKNNNVVDHVGDCIMRSNVDSQKMFDWNSDGSDDLCLHITYYTQCCVDHQRMIYSLKNGKIKRIFAAIISRDVDCAGRYKVVFRYRWIGGDKFIVYGNIKEWRFNEDESQYLDVDRDTTYVVSNSPVGDFLHPDSGY